MKRTWIDDLQPGDKVVCHIPEDNCIQIRYVLWTGDLITLTKGAMWFRAKDGYTEDRRIFLSPYYPGLETILPVWGDPPRENVCE